MKEYQEKLERLNEDKTFVSAISYEEDQKLTLNTEKQISYEEGIQKGIEKGIREGVQEGIQSKQYDIVKEMHKQNFSLEQISSIVKLPIEEIKNILGEN